MSQEAKVIVQLREMILGGELSGGERILEATIAEKLNVSRTPIRYALSVLAAEGLIVGGGKRGFTVRAFTMQDIAVAIDVRGALEGLAARMAAEKGLSQPHLAAFKRCLADGDELLSRGSVAKGDDETYERINREFHSLLLEAAGSDHLSNALATNDRLPFAAAGAVALETEVPTLLRTQYSLLFSAHTQHHAIVEALENQESWRLQSLMQEHALVAKRNITMMASRHAGELDPDAPVNGKLIQELRFSAVV
ncbi:GntR family transcriptional regulator [Burkholderia cenocepacia]|uniref:GntR family transcriptional regulator n=1 Tax=Burkholderia cenocepacia TaxID=95486 RepID=UPI0028656828|nr:GntR family transcriptional regulator [Burkholderia cenocepacia]MDR8071396.1 GntR family transcriptional regulator [Burkholderia cenocepacia]